MDLARQGKDGGCIWFVADSESNFCFFKFIQDNNHPITPNKIAQKLLIDDADIKKIVNNFRKKSREIIESTKSSKKS